MAYDAKAIANYFLDLARASNSALTPMKLQKLVFFAHGWCLALYGRPLIADAVEAWKFGPVIPSLYHEFKSAGSAAIETPASTVDLENFDLVFPRVPQEDRETRELLDQVWRSYGGLSAYQLSSLTHLPGSPWSQVREGREDDARGVVIPEPLIARHFAAQAEKNRAAA
jgi:uncharacterized phage-associated protein